MSAFAQEPSLRYSDGFPENPGYKMQPILCDNGNTFLAKTINNANTIVDLFNTEGKKIATTPVNRLGGSPVQGDIIGFLHHGNEATLFFSWEHMRTPYLFRAVISAESGKVVSVDTLFILEPYEKTSGFAMAFANVDRKEFFIKVDNNTGCYAVVAYDGFASETSQRIEFAHYNAKHVEIGHSFYTMPDDHFKYVRYLDAAVDGEKRMFVIAYAYNTRRSGGKESQLTLSTFENGKLTNSPLNSEDDFTEARAILEFNKKQKALQFLFLAKDKKHSRGASITYSAGVVSINIDNGQPVYAKNVDLPCLEAYRKSNFNMKDDFTAMIDDMYINEDGTVTIVLEEQLTTITSAGAASSSYSSRGDIGIVIMDNQGNTKSCYSFRKYHDHVGAKNTVDISFFGYRYLSTHSGNFVLYNDHEDSFNEGENRQFILSRAGVSQTAYHCLNTSVPAKQHLFGAPSEKREHRFAFLKKGDFNNTLNSFAVLMVNDKNGSKTAHVAWVKF